MRDSKAYINIIFFIITCRILHFCFILQFLRRVPIFIPIPSVKMFKTQLGPLWGTFWDAKSFAKFQKSSPYELSTPAFHGSVSFEKQCKELNLDKALADRICGIRGVGTFMVSLFAGLGTSGGVKAILQNVVLNANTTTWNIGVTLHVESKIQANISRD